jgi:hypothetical protein
MKATGPEGGLDGVFKGLKGHVPSNFLMAFLSSIEIIDLTP